MRTACAVLAVIVAGSPRAASQTLPVSLRAAFYGESDTSAATRAENLFLAYLHKRFNALGLKIVNLDDTVTTMEVNFSVLPLHDGSYDVAYNVTVLNCGLALRRACTRSFPMDWGQLHEYADLEKAAREIAEGLYGDDKAFRQVMYAADSMRSTPRRP